MLLGPPPRRRRRWPLLLAVGIVAIFVAVLVTNVRTKSRVLSAYLNTASSSMTTVDRVSSELTDLTARLGAIERPALQGSFDATQDLLAGVVQDLQQVEVPAEATLEHARLLLATESWADGVDRLRQGLVGYADGEIDAADSIAEAVLLLRIGDRSYRSFVDRLPALAETLDTVPPDLPIIQLAGPLINTDILIARVSVAPDIALRRDLAIASVRLDPRPLAQNEVGVSIIPLTESLDLQVAIQNVGNEVETGIELTMRISGSASVSESATIPSLAAGASTTESFSITVVPGAQYSIEASVVGVENEVNLDNNLFFDQFVINQERTVPDSEN
ncbi:MAG: hypothetical protein HKO03_03940 [Acidimicrobiia bacterium]|nr:hypothetical protein [Acidimicrobiia bacterium]